MLQAILNELRQARKPLGLRELSEKLAVQPSALEGMLMQLVRMGKLELLEGSTGSRCGGCPGCAKPDDCSLVFRVPARYQVKS